VQPESGFEYDEKSFVTALDEFVQEVGLTGPFHLITHGFVLGQYGLLWALQHAQDIEKLVILGTPLSQKAKLRPELAAYKNPLSFLRPKPDAKFAGDLYNAAGLAFVISYDDAQVRCLRL
jgi:pimeloyl-ACP methyl ester carboxylesterase